MYCTLLQARSYDHLRTREYPRRSARRNKTVAIVEPSRHIVPPRLLECCKAVLLANPMHYNRRSAGGFVVSPDENTLVVCSLPPLTCGCTCHLFFFLNILSETHRTCHQSSTCPTRTCLGHALFCQPDNNDRAKRRPNRKKKCQKSCTYVSFNYPINSVYQIC